MLLGCLSLLAGVMSTTVFYYVVTGMPPKQFWVLPL